MQIEQGIPGLKERISRSAMSLSVPKRLFGWGIQNCEAILSGSAERRLEGAVQGDIFAKDATSVAERVDLLGCRKQISSFVEDVKELSRFLDWQLQQRGKRRISRVGIRLRLFWMGVLSFVYQQKKAHIPICCDVLLIHPSKRSFNQGRKQHLINALRDRGMHVEEIIESDDLLIDGRCFSAPPCTVPLSYRWHAAHASYLLSKYQAKAIITERNGWIVPSFIKRFRKKDAKILHLAHSVLTAQSESYSYYDYDYYFLFGSSSYEYLSGMDRAFGECLIFYAGPYFFKDEIKLLGNSHVEDDAQVFLFLAPGPEYEKRSGYYAQCSWVVDWLKENKATRLNVKVHPRGTGEPWKTLSMSAPQIKILPLDTQLEEVAAQSSLVLTGYTNAIIDVSRVGTPFILLGEDPSYFSTESFGMPRVRTAGELDSAIKDVMHNRVVYKEQSLRFFSYHVEHGLFPLASLVAAIQVVVSGGTLEGALLVSPKN